MSKFRRHHSSHGAIAKLTFLLLLSACASNDNSHTTATTYVTPPPRQMLTVVPTEKGPATSVKTETKDGLTTKAGSGVDPSKPLLIFKAPVENQVFSAGEVVVVDFSVLNAKLKDEGGECRIRYVVDDDDAKWVDTATPLGLKGWVPGKHIIRLELIGPDGWPYRNGDQNIITREIIVSAQ